VAIAAATSWSDLAPQDGVQSARSGPDGDSAADDGDLTGPDVGGDDITWRVTPEPTDPAPLCVEGEHSRGSGDREGPPVLVLVAEAGFVAPHRGESAAVLARAVLPCIGQLGTIGVVGISVGIPGHLPFAARVSGGQEPLARGLGADEQGLGDLGEVSIASRRSSTAVRSVCSTHWASTDRSRTEDAGSGSPSSMSRKSRMAAAGLLADEHVVSMVERWPGYSLL